MALPLPGEYFYYAPWFILLQLLQAVNLSAMFLRGSYFKRISKGSLIFHGAFLFIWLGAAVTHYVGVTGIMHIREGETANSMMRDEGAGIEKTSLPFSVTLDDFRLERYPGSHSPMSYESDLVIKRGHESPLLATIRMNKVIDVDGYRLFQSSFDPDEQGTVLSVSYDRPGMLRAMLIRDEAEERDLIYKLETNIDDCTGESLGYAMDRLMEAGARDVHYTPVYMKKNRPAYQLNVICAGEDIDRMEEIIFRETTTIGIRWIPMERTVLRREMRTVQTPLGEAQVKVCTYGGTERYFPEYNSVTALCRAHGRSYQEVYQMIEHACV